MLTTPAAEFLETVSERRRACPSPGCFQQVPTGSCALAGERMQRAPPPHQDVRGAWRTSHLSPRQEEPQPWTPRHRPWASPTGSAECGRSPEREARPRSLCKDVRFEARSARPGTGTGRHMAAAAGGEQSRRELAAHCLSQDRVAVSSGCPPSQGGTWRLELLHRLAQVTHALPGWHGPPLSPA